MSQECAGWVYKSFKSQFRTFSVAKESFRNMNGAMTSLEDAVNAKPAVHPSDRVAGVNWAKRRDSPRLNRDHVITSRSKTSLRRGLGRGGWWEDVGAIISARGRQSSVRDPSHTPVRCLSVLTLPTDGPWLKGRQGKEEGGREGDLKHSSSSGLTAMSQREGGFQESAWRVLRQTFPTPLTDTAISVWKWTLSLKMSYFWHPLQGESLASLYLLLLYNGSGVGK